MPAATTTPPTPAPLALERRRWTALFSLPFAVVIAFHGVLALRWLPAVLGPRPGLVVGALWAIAALALGGWIGRGAWKALTEPGPALVLDARGITDNFHLHAQVPWSAVQSFTLDHGDGNRLVLVLRPGAFLPDGRIVRNTWTRAARRLVDGGDLAIPLGGLVYQPKRLRESLQAHLARARAGTAPDRVDAH